MEMSIIRETHLHLQGLTLPTMEEEKKKKTKNSLISPWTTNTQQGGKGVYSLFFRGRVRFRGGPKCRTPRFFHLFFLFELTILKDLSFNDVAPCGACRPWILFINGVLCFLKINGSEMEMEER